MPAEYKENDKVMVPATIKSVRGDNLEVALDASMSATGNGTYIVGQANVRAVDDSGSSGHGGSSGGSGQGGGRPHHPHHGR